VTKEYILSLLYDINQSVLGSEDTILNPNELESSVYSAFQTFGGKELFPSDIDKIIHICASLSASHCFKDANKRTTSAFLITALKYLGLKLDLDHIRLADIIISLVNHKLSEEDFEAIIINKLRKL